MLLQYEERLVEIWIAASDLLLKNPGLRMLASQAEDCGSRDIWMIDVTRNQATEIVRVFAGSSTAAFMNKKLDAINILKKPSRRRVRTVARHAVGANSFFGLPLSIQPRQFGDLLPVRLRTSWFNGWYWSLGMTWELIRLRGLAGNRDAVTRQN